MAAAKKAPTKKTNVRDVIQESAGAGKPTPPPAITTTTSGSPDAALWAQGGQSPVGIQSGDSFGGPGGRYTSDIPLGTDNTNPMTGFASQYTPTGMQSYYDNPEIIAQDVLNALGYPGNFNAGMMPELANMAAAGLPLSLILGGGALPTDMATINLTNDLLRQGLTPGGSTVDPAMAMQAIFGADPNSALGMNLAGPGMTPEQQAAALRYYIGASIGGLNPLAQNAVMNSLEAGALNWNAGMAHGDLTASGMPFYQYQRQNNPLIGAFGG